MCVRVCNNMCVFVDVCTVCRYVCVCVCNHMCFWMGYACVCAVYVHVGMYVSIYICVLFPESVHACRVAMSSCVFLRVGCLCLHVCFCVCLR